MRLYTIGHSTHSIDSFVEILQNYNITQIVDVRSVPRSRHTPQFNTENLQEQLLKCDIDYRHLKNLGGLRHAHKDSPNQGWHNDSFRGYADYMQTTDFADGIAILEKIMRDKVVAIMCAEAVPWRCHRSMIGDAMLVRDYEVIDIFDKNKSQPETITKFARVKSLSVTYPDDQPKR